MVKSLNFQSHFQLMGPSMIIIQAGAFEKKLQGFLSSHNFDLKYFHVYKIVAEAKLLSYLFYCHF